MADEKIDSTTWTREDVRALLHDLDRFVRDVDFGTAGGKDDIARRSSNLQRRLDAAEEWLDRETV